ncbi:MAG TPA: hypothetical protein VGE52_18300 [Pirellulales bacterium]
MNASPAGPDAPGGMNAPGGTPEPQPARPHRWSLRDQFLALFGCAILFAVLRLIEPRYSLLATVAAFWIGVFVVAVRRRHLLAINVQWSMLISALVLASLPLSAGRDWDTIVRFVGGSLLVSALTTLIALSADDFQRPPPAPGDAAK